MRVHSARQAATSDYSTCPTFFYVFKYPSPVRNQMDSLNFRSIFHFLDMEFTFTCSTVQLFLVCFDKSTPLFVFFCFTLFTFPICYCLERDNV